MAEFTDETKNLIWSLVHTTPAVDARVFAEAPGLTHPGVSGIDALLTTPEILAEFFRRRALGRPAVGAGDPGAYAEHEAYVLSLTRGELADIVWRQLFVDHSPASEPARIVLTTMGMFGLDVSSGDLRLLREQYAAIPAEERLKKSLELANVELILHPVESMSVEEHCAGRTQHPAFRPVLYVNELLEDWKESARKLRLEGFGVKAKVDEFTPLELRRYLGAEIARLKPTGVGLDWPDGKHAPGDNCIGRLVREAVLPLCREHGLTVFLSTAAMRIGDLSPLWRECQEVRFLLFPGREEAFYPATLEAARNRNVMLCGPDQPLSYPRIMEGFTGLRLENLGSGFHACHSGADAVEEMVGCWAHQRWTLGKALIRHYMDLWRTGWVYDEAALKRDIAALLGGNLRRFVGLGA